jgi:hypothetical protein
MMHPISRTCTLFLVGLLILPLSVQAQELASGTWTGLVVPPDNENLDVTYTVATVNDTLQITMHVPEHGDMVFSNVRFEEGDLKFSWQPGPIVHCVMKAKEGGEYNGECTDEGGDPGYMVMTPPE